MTGADITARSSRAQCSSALRPWRAMLLGAALCVLASGGPALAGGKAAKPSTPNFTGLWRVADPNLIVRPDVNATRDDYTDEAWANLQDYREHWDTKVDDPAKFCVAHGMPNTMTSRARDYLTDIYQTGDRITVLVEFMDNHRVIRFGDAPVPDTFAPSPNGWSRAKWEGRTLVIETEALKEKNPVGPMQRSDEARIVERWSLVQHPKFGEVLDIDMTVTDPKVFRHPVKARQVYMRAEPGSVLNHYGCADSLWDDWVARKQAARKATGAAP